MTAREAIRAASLRLAAKPELRETATRDAEYLLLHQLGMSRARLHAYPNYPLTPGEQEGYESRIARRLANEPVQYITGEQEFYGLLLQVTPAVLIPRPETELLVEAVLERLPKEEHLRILDVGTGSCAIALALAMHLPQAELTAVDLSPAALEISRRNARTHALEGRMELLQSDLLAALGDRAFDCIVSNPPYIPIADAPDLHPQVRDHEPHLALFAGAEGLGIYRRLVPEALQALVPGGLLALEIGHGQRNALASLLEEWADVAFLNDLQGIPRVVLARRPS